MDDGQRKPLGLFGNLVTENLAEQLMDNWVEAFLTEAVTVLFGLPEVDVTEAPLGTL